MAIIKLSIPDGIEHNIFEDVDGFKGYAASLEDAEKLYS